MKYFVNFIFIFSLFLSACNQPVSLGSRLSMAGPMVNISKPVPDLTVDETDPSVRTVFNVSGTVMDEIKITLMNVTLDYWDAEAESLTRMAREWKWEKQWMVRESEEEDWQPYTKDSYNPADADPRIPVTPPSWSVNKNLVNWNLPVNMNRMEQGEYFITVSAWNSAGRYDSQSSAKLKIKYNNLAPTVRIINPLLLAGSGSLSFPKPPEWDEYIFDPFNAPEETSMNLMYYTNSFNDLSYRLEYTISPPTAFSFEITNEHDLDDFAEEKAAYYRWKWEGEEFPPQMGIFTDRAATAEDTYARVGGRIELSDTVKNSLPRSAVTPMQLVTRVKDATGLEEYKSKGWFLYLPDSDRPYTYIDFGHRVHKDAAAPADAAELASMLRGSTNYNNLAYDDDGVKELKWTVYKLKDDSLETERTAGTGSVSFEGNKKEAWPFQAHRSFGTGRFKITVTVCDIYGTWGDEFHGYFTIFSNTTPTVVTPMDSPDSLTTTFWGDANGNIIIKGRAQIEDYDECDGLAHGVRVNEVTIVWIKPNVSLENNLRCLDINDPLWNAADGFADSNGNKVWKVLPSFVAATAGNNSPNAQEEWEFSKTLNYFSDLGIGPPPGGPPFNDQQFRIRVLSEGGLNVLARSSVYAFTTRGDVTAPVLEITHIVIKHEGVEKAYYLSPDGDSETLPVIAKDDEVKLRGTYSDDSIGNWTGLGSDRHEDWLTGFEVKWTGGDTKFTWPSRPSDPITTTITSFTLENQSGGNWETGWYEFEDHNTDPIIQLSAGLTDVGGRRGTANVVLVVETINPILVRISSKDSDGYYGPQKGAAGTRFIDIYLEFNKPVSFLNYPGAPGLSYGTAPHLELNNGGKAFYVPSNDPEDKITFRYFYSTADGVPPDMVTATPVPGFAGGDTAGYTDAKGRLNVASVEFGTFFTEENWTGMSDVPAKFGRDEHDPNKLAVCNPAYEYSLAMQKNIIIDVTPPVIQTVSTSATAGRYGKGSEINIDVKFSEDVQISSGATEVNTYLSLTGGNLASQSARAGYQNVKDSKTLNFKYIVAANHDTSESPAPAVPLGVSAMIAQTGITDLAGNPATLTIAANTTLTGVIIDTVAPAAPTITGVTANASYYGDSGTTFTVTGIVSGNTVEYNLNYDSGNPERGWTYYNNGNPVTGTATGAIPLTINGIYQIAARQYDTAIPPNPSPPSAVIQPVRINKGAILQGITSSMSDGAYSFNATDTNKKTVTIDLEFRVPVTLVGAATGGTVTLNVQGNAANTAALNTPPVGGSSTKWTFTYAIPSGAYTPVGSYLDVTAINLDSLTINDEYGVRVNGSNGWLTLSSLDATPDRKLINRKKIVILAGAPRVLNPPTTVIQATNPATPSEITFTGTPLKLKLTFDREIFRGRTTNSLVIRQIADGYKIPAVLTETQWNDIFFNRNDINYGSTGLTAATWYTLGGQLYEKGSNGATPGTVTNLNSDTSVKWVLKFGIDPDSDTIPTGLGITATMADIRTVFRSAEAIRFLPGDQQVEINGRDLFINFGTGRSLPVRGARYEWDFPNGFVQDVLGTANGLSTSGIETALSHNLTPTTNTTGDAPRVLFYNNAIDPPVIRVNKDPATSFFNNDTTNYRQIRQPLFTQVRINSRTPGAVIQYWKRQTTDNVSKLLQQLTYGVQLLHPMVALSDIYQETGLWPGLPTDWGNPIPYALNNLPAIGSDLYTDGGMIIHLRARATATDVTDNPITYGYEAAYRSVFVYINQSYWAGSNVMEESAGNLANLHRLDNGNLLTSNLDRVWIRGSNNLSGDTTVPDFPISRDWTKSRKAKLLTPLYLSDTTTTNGPGHVDNSPTPAAVITADTAFTEGNIVNRGNYGNNDAEWRKGRNHWYWVTWGINVPAFIDIFYGELPGNANDAYQTPRTNVRPLLGGSSLLREYYAVFPGRTTAYQVHGQSFIPYPPFMPAESGDFHRSGSVFAVPDRDD